jgi:hypothetical protein
MHAPQVAAKFHRHRDVVAMVKTLQSILPDFYRFNHADDHTLSPALAASAILVDVGPNSLGQATPTSRPDKPLN